MTEHIAPHQIKVVIIIQARMLSSRLPGKVMREVLGKPLLGYMLERVQRCRNVHQIVVATSTNSADDAIADYCKIKNVACFRGSEDDVLERYYEAAKAFQALGIVRLTADCPVHDPELIDAVVNVFSHAWPWVQYISNTEFRSYPRGMDVEVFSYQWLRFAHKNAESKLLREHVTPYIYLSMDKTKIANFVSARENLAHLRLVVDEPADFELIAKIIENLYPVTPDFDLDNILELLDENPEWLKINAQVEQKKDPGDVGHKQRDDRA